jgi:hypothetical protein
VEFKQGIGPVQGSCRRKLGAIIEDKVTDVKRNIWDTLLSGWGVAFLRAPLPLLFGRGLHSAPPGPELLSDG